MFRKLFIIFLCFLFISSPVFAQENSPQTPSQTVNYVLPFPGLLPGHPLYGLKVMRDKVYDFFLTDALKKAEFKLLMADKRVAMGQILHDMGQPDLAEETLSKALNYYRQVFGLLEKVPKVSGENRSLDTKTYTAGLKYQEILNNLKENSDGVNREKYLNLENHLVEIMADNQINFNQLQDNN